MAGDFVVGEMKSNFSFVVVYNKLVNKKKVVFYGNGLKLSLLKYEFFSFLTKLNREVRYCSDMALNGIDFDEYGVL